jgi:uncharacterized protein (DUF58 family)
VINVKALSQLFSRRDLRNAALGLFVIFGGIGLAVLIYYAQRTGQPRLAGIAAAISLVFILLLLIFVVPPLARNAGREASQMNLPFEFTAGGAMMLGLMAIVGFSAWNTGNNLLFLILSFLTAAMVVGFFVGGLCLKKLDVRMRFPETIFAGEETPILVTVTNRKRVFPSYSVVAEVRGKERDRSVAAEDLHAILPAWVADRISRPPLSRRTLDYFAYIRRNQSTESNRVQIFQNRGRFVIQDFELSTKFPFGFFRHRRRLPAREAELIVFPPLVPVDNETDDQPIEAGRLTAGKRGMGQDLLSLREYRPNDDLRRVDWKATARTRHLIVREFAAEDDKKVTILLDTRIPRESENKMTVREKLEAEQQGKPVVLSERFERGVSLAASLLAHFTELQTDLRLVIGDTVGEFGVGGRHLYESLRRLAVAEPAFVDVGQTLSVPNEIFGDTANGHNFFVSAIPEAGLPAEITERSNIVVF